MRSRVIAMVVAVTTLSAYVVVSDVSVFLRIPKSSKSGVADTDVNDPEILLAQADHFYWLDNSTKAAPLYAKAEHLFASKGDVRGELHAKVGLRRSEAETMSYAELSGFLNEQLLNPAVSRDPKLKLRCLVAKGYTDVELNFQEAKRDWTEAKDLARALGMTQWVTRASGELGLIAFMQGDARKGAKLLGRALLSTMATGDTGGQIRFLALLGGGFEQINRNFEALKFFDRAINLARANKECGFPYMALEGKAESLIGLGKLDDADRVLKEALAQARLEERFGHQADILILLGKLAERTGNRSLGIKYMEEAERYGMQMKLYRVLADSLLELANLYRDSGDLASAESRAVRGLAASQRVGDLYFVPRDMTVLADVKARQGRVAEANVLYHHAEDVIAGMLMTIDGPIWNSSAAASMSQTYLHHFELMSRNGDVSGAFEVLEQVRGRTLVLAMREKKTFDTGDSAETLQLEHQISALQKDLMRVSSSSAREEQLERLVEFERRLELAGTARHSMASRLPVKPSSLRRVQQDLKPDETLIEYVLDDPASFCFSISRQSAQLHILPAGRAKIENLSKRVLEEIGAKGTAVESSRELYDLLIRPVQVPATTRELIIVPDGLLNVIPLEVLRDDLGEYVLKSYAVSYAPSGTVFDLLRHSDSQQPAKPLLGVGGVDYVRSSAAINMALPSSSGEQILRDITTLIGIRLHDLPHTREEVTKISEIMGPGSFTLLGTAATETAFKSEPLDQFRIVHLAVHGFTDTQLPERSALLLGVDPQSSDDGLLQIREIINLRFNADLITLSACDSALGKLQGQEGVSNLVEAFLVAGSKSVVASLWQADDTFASILMQEFYRRLSEGESIAYALRDAKLALLAKYGYQLNAYYWAPFVAFGEGSRRTRSD